MMPIPAKESPNSARTSLLATFALLLLAANQLAFAGHQFEHVAGDVIEVCGVCLQLERSDELLTGDIEVHTTGVTPHAEPALAPAAVASATRWAFRPRGPPTP